MKRRKNFRRKPKEKKMNGLQVEVYNNNVEKALRIFKKKVKESNLMLELKKKEYNEKHEFEYFKEYKEETLKPKKIKFVGFKKAVKNSANKI